MSKKPREARRQAARQKYPRGARRGAITVNSYNARTKSIAWSIKCLAVLCILCGLAGLLPTHGFFTSGSVALLGTGGVLHILASLSSDG